MVHEHGSLPLDPMQRIAVEAAEGVSLVTGGAGTGKTHALVGRVAHLLDAGVQPGHITCLAVRDEAAAALRRRMASHPRIRGHLDEVFVGTMHEYANLFLRRAGAAVLGLSPGYTLWDRRTAVEAVRTAWADHHKSDLKHRDIEAALDWHWRNLALPRDLSAPSGTGGAVARGGGPLHTGKAPAGRPGPSGPAGPGGRGDDAGR